MELVVTPEQLRQGYVLKPEPDGRFYYKLPYKVLRKLDDGNYLVDYSHEVVDA
jgi:hypothetical protein